MEEKIFFIKNKEDAVRFNQIKQQVDEAINNISGTRRTLAKVKAISFPVIFLLLYLSAIFYIHNIGLFFLFYGLMGIATLLIFLNLIHEAVHGLVFKKQWKNQAMLYIFDLLGANSYIWKRRHNILHHGFQNVAGWDSDIEQAGLFRIYPHEEKRKFQAHQHRLVFIFYPLYLANWVLIRDFKDFFSSKQLIRKVSKIPLREYFILFFFKLFYLFYIVIVPYMLGLSLMQSILAMFFMLIIAGTLALNFLLTPHVNVKNKFPLPDSNGRLPFSWLEHQFATTNDVKNCNWFTRNLLGNFNFHIAHHLFPRISSIYAPEVTEIIKKYADRHKLGYRSYSMKNALKYHFQLIKSNAIGMDIFEENM
jgi:linoleoyl-CoA desaturase